MQCQSLLNDDAIKGIFCSDECQEEFAREILGETED